MRIAWKYSTDGTFEEYPVPGFDKDDTIWIEICGVPDSKNGKPGEDRGRSPAQMSGGRFWETRRWTRAWE
jgi:hypothetical protein